MIKKIKFVKWIAITAIIAVVFSGCSSEGIMESKELKEVELEHVHGLGYSPDGNKLFFASHDGLRVYEKGQWIQPAGEKHDYMGFSMVDDGFYSSGHPASGSKKKNPFGIVKSTDEGKSLEPLTLYGEVDFHGMSVGYKSHAIYLFNLEPNSAIETLGLHYSTDEAKTWTMSEMKGLNGNPTALAVHQTEESVVALGTDQGVFVSKDYGQHFEKLSSDMQVSSLSFTAKGDLLAGGVEQQAVLFKFNLESKKAEQLEIPVMTNDAIAHIAQNPINEQDISIMTIGNNAYTSTDFGKNWTKILDQGKGVSAPK
ncbi:F510_1955 family glycosylhydrolase [Cohnella algarum]|uniref:F510_1955 family glycosylhydrolase n=1 Tax=Cohnella algarum TaxID=2044859 RepID=UPI001967A34C|nr:glycosyl hydrolase [Cohnella algarum]MBN2981806.1 glycosyl hydrolase [Cohnella algarum]